MRFIAKNEMLQKETYITVVYTEITPTKRVKINLKTKSSKYYKLSQQFCNHTMIFILNVVILHGILATVTKKVTKSSKTQIKL